MSLPSSTSTDAPRRATILLRRANQKDLTALPPPPGTSSPSSSAPPPPALPTVANFGELDSDTNIVFVPATVGTPRPEVKAATLLKLVERLTYEKYPDPKFLRQFLLTYRSFTDPESLIKLLFDRYMWVPTKDADDYINTKQRPIRLRVYNVLKAWLQNHYHDFEVSKALKKHLLSFIDEMMRTQMETSATALTKELNRTKNEGSSIGGSSGGTQITGAPKSILPKTSVIRTILDINPEELARQITLVEHQLFKEIQANEFLGLAWAKRREHAPNILRLINWSNRMIKWVATTIVTEADYRKRVSTLKLILDTAENLKKLNNFNGVMEIVSGLNSSACFRLRKTWGAIGKAYEQKFEDLKELVSRDSNFKNFREYLKTKISPPSIPYMGVYLTDLTFIEDGHNDLTAEGLINFEKRRQVAKVIEDLLYYQKDPYLLNDVVIIQEMLKTARVLNEEDQYSHSHAREKKVGKGETVLVEAGEAGASMPPEAEDEDWGELQQIPQYPFSEKDSPGKNILMNGTSLSGATFAKLIERATPASGHGADIVPIILTTYRKYSSSLQLVEFLRHRFFMPKPMHCTPELLSQFDRKRMTPIRVRTIGFVKQWIDKYTYDIRNDPPLTAALVNFLTEAVAEPVVSKTCQASIQNLQKVEEVHPNIVPLFPPTLDVPLGQPVGAFLNLSVLDVGNHLLYLSRSGYEHLRPVDFLNPPSIIVEHLVTLSNDIRLWFVTELIRPKASAHETLEVFTHTVAIANECLSQRNFLAANAIYLALERVHDKLKPLYALLPPKLAESYTTFSKIFGPTQDYFNVWEGASGAAVPAIHITLEKFSKLMEPSDMVGANLINITKMQELTLFLKSVLNFVKEESLSLQSAETLAYLTDATVIDESEVDLCLETLLLPETSSKSSGEVSDPSNIRALITDTLKDVNFRKQLRLDLLSAIKDDIFRTARQEMTLIGLRAGLITAKAGRNILLDLVERHFSSHSNAMINEWSHTNSEVLGFQHTFVLFVVDTSSGPFLVYVEPHLGLDELSVFLRLVDIYKRENSIQDITLVCIASTMDEAVLRPALQAGVSLQAAADESLEPSQVPLQSRAQLNREAVPPGSPVVTPTSSSRDMPSPHVRKLTVQPANANPALRRAATVVNPGVSSEDDLSSSGGGRGGISPMSSPRPFRGGPPPRGHPLPSRFASTTALPRRLSVDPASPDSPPSPEPVRTSHTTESPRSSPLADSDSRPSPSPPALLPKPVVLPKPVLPAKPVVTLPPAPAKPISEWDTDDVCQWLESKGFASVVEKFRSNLIQGPDLVDLQETELSDELEITDPSVLHSLATAISSLS